jgi:hypothetical protein
MRAVVLAAAVAFAAVPAAAQSPNVAVNVAPNVGVDVTGLAGQVARFDAAALSAMPQAKATLNAHGETHVYEGPLLIDVLAKVGAPTGQAIRGPEMADVVLVTGQDGYRVALGLAEIDPGVRADRIILADRVDNHAIEGKDGPIRLVVEGDLKPARSVRMVSSIAVVRAGEWGMTRTSRRSVAPPKALIGSDVPSEPMKVL